MRIKQIQINQEVMLHKDEEESTVVATMLEVLEGFDDLPIRRVLTQKALN